MEVDRAYSLIAHAINSERVPGGYLVVGDVKGDCAELVDRIAAKLYPDDAERLAAHCHPDVAVLEPEGRSRTIKVESMRERIVEPMASTSFSGGWKVGVVSGADRMQPAAANAFLKSLEEPTPRTLFLLLTDQPDALLPTIVSRCQRIDLSTPRGELDGEAYDAVKAVMTAKIPADAIYLKAKAGRRLTEILAELKDEAEDEDVPIVRKRFYRTIMAFVREWMVSGAVERFRAYRNVEAVEEAFRQSERAMPDEAVLTFLTDRMTFPA